MASTACSSTCINGGDFFALSHALRKEANRPNLCGGVTVAPYASFHGHICVARKKHLFPVKAFQSGPIFLEQKSLKLEWMNFQMAGKLNFCLWSLPKQCRYLVKAVATVEPYCLITSESGLMDDSSFWFDSNPDVLMPQSSADCPELYQREALRRKRISKANKGNIPWNKGRKHSPETLQKIRERTKLAMQDPKVKRKLMNLGHAQSDETKKKIAVGVRHGWERRRGLMMIQERCLFEWKNMVAEASRKGYAGEVELQWDSYKIIDEQLKQMWLENIEKRKSMPRTKGSKRAPKSLEQRRKISEAISAKWADPEYRNRVCAALSKYHGTLIGTGKKPKRKPSGETSPEKSISARKKPEQTAQLNIELQNFKQLTQRKRKNSAPSFKDPMSSSKLELLKKIKADRAEIETKKREATIRAKLLIAEAERAAEALEEAALKSPLAKASLLETRKLIAEANLSLKSIESGQLMSRETAVEPCLNMNSDGSKQNLQINVTTRINKSTPNEKLVNGFHNLSSTHTNDEIIQLGMRHGMEVDEGSEAASCDILLSNYPKRVESVGEEKTVALDISDLDSRTPNDSQMGSKRTRKWVCGRFVESED